MAKLEVGQKLWFVPRHSQAREITVTKVGRKWADADGTKGRICLETLGVVEGGYTFGRCVLDREAYEASLEHGKAWRALLAGLHRTANASIPTDAIYQAAALLGVEMPERASGAADKGGE